MRNAKHGKRYRLSGVIAIRHHLPTLAGSQVFYSVYHPTNHYAHRLVASFPDTQNFYLLICMGCTLAEPDPRWGRGIEANVTTPSPHLSFQIRDCMHRMLICHLNKRHTIKAHCLYTLYRLPLLLKLELNENPPSSTFVYTKQ